VLLKFSFVLVTIVFIVNLAYSSCNVNTEYDAAISTSTVPKNEPISAIEEIAVHCVPGIE
jgi:hypothetical protein